MGDLGEVRDMGTNYLKILGSGEIVRWKDFSEITQVYVVESVDGKTSRVQSNKVSQQVTPVEIAEFERVGAARVV
jgi:hypothetical protein